MKRMRRVLWLLLAFAGPAAGANLLWEVSGEGGSGFLLGSIHVAPSDLYPLPAVIEEAFEGASKVVFEIDPSQITPEALMSVQLGSAQCGDVEASLDAKGRAALQKRTEGLGEAAELLKVVPPGLLAADLVVEEVTAKGYRAENGIDHHFLSRTHEANKPLAALETVEEQFRLLTDCETGRLMLKDTLAHLDEMGEQLEKMIVAWKAGDDSRLERIAILEPLARDPGMQPYYQRYFFDRNRRMSEKIAAMLSRGERPFVVVGAGHLVGEQGIVALLKRRGFTTRQL